MISAWWSVILPPTIRNIVSLTLTPPITLDGSLVVLASLISMIDHIFSIGNRVDLVMTDYWYTLWPKIFHILSPLYFPAFLFCRSSFDVSSVHRCLHCAVQSLDRGVFELVNQWIFTPHLVTGMFTCFSVRINLKACTSYFPRTSSDIVCWMKDMFLIPWVRSYHEVCSCSSLVILYSYSSLSSFNLY